MQYLDGAHQAVRVALRTPDLAEPTFPDQLIEVVTGKLEGV